MFERLRDKNPVNREIEELLNRFRKNSLLKSNLKLFLAIYVQELESFSHFHKLKKIL
jgi:hypothetical protein